MSDKEFGKYSRTVTISAEAYKKYYKQKRYSMRLVVAAYYKLPNQTELYRYEGGFVDQGVFATANTDVKLQGYVFKRESEMNVHAVSHVRKGTRFRFPNHRWVYEVVEAAIHTDDTVGIMNVERGVYYDIEGFREVDVIHS